MVHFKDYVAGWLDSSIHEFLAAMPGNSSSMKYALVTCVDSSLDPYTLLDMSPELASLSPEAKPLGRGILVPAKLLLEADGNTQMFFGFDEVWFFPSDRIEPKPDSAWIVGPIRVDQARLEKLGEWMSANDCSLALGDGEGLNLIVKARGLVKHVVGHSIEQPQGTFITAHAGGIAG